MDMIKGINHIGVIVTDIESVVEKLSNLYGIEKPSVKFVESRNIKVAVVQFGGVSIELLEDLNDVLTLPSLDRERQEKKSGNYIHHYALTSTEIDKDIAELEKKGCVRIGDGPKVGLRGKRIQFYHDTATDLLVELTEE
jgi:methylmalonyl-CoA epimerase